MTQQGLHREKAPQAVIAAIIEHACQHALQYGFPSLTLQAVADSAGVTKSGLMHHFKTKSQLLAAVRQRAFDLFSDALEDNMRNDPGGPGTFTRAYIRTCLESARDTPDLRLIASLWGMPALRNEWYEWLQQQEEMHAATDGSTHCKIARLAADGAWLAAQDGTDTREWEQQLLLMVPAATS